MLDLVGMAELSCVGGASVRLYNCWTISANVLHWKKRQAHATLSKHSKKRRRVAYRCTRI